ncbi:MAG: hypothetical protein ACK5IJ_12405 [Mangrovibacterium sp.]
MASLRDLKKDIDFLCGELVIDCIFYVQTSDDADLEKAQEVLNDALLLNGDLRAKANHPNGKDNAKMVKAYYRALRKEMLDKCNAMYEKLSPLA